MKQIHLIRRAVSLLLLLSLCLSLSGCALGGALGLLGLSAFEKPEICEDPAEYGRYFGPGATEEYLAEENLDTAIFPAALTPEMDVREFRMIYYNPWDPQWLGYLTVAYSEADYAREAERLAAFPRGSYEGVYSVTGFAEEPLAVNVDSYQGFVYAIPTPGEKNSVTYVLMEFCNYFYDLDYKAYIPEDYLPQGFDATSGNPYRAVCLKTAGLAQSPEPVDLEAYAEYELLREEVLRRCEKLDAAGLAAQPEAVAVFYRVDAFWTQYSCGGFFGYFANSAGRDYGPSLLEDLDRIGASEHRAMLKSFLEENDIDLTELSDFKWSNMNKLSERINFADFDYHFSELPPLWKILTDYAKANSGEFTSLS